MTEIVEKWQALADKLIEGSLEVLKKGVVPEENLVWSDPKVISIHSHLARRASCGLADPKMQTAASAKRS